QRLGPRLALVGYLVRREVGAKPCAISVKEDIFHAKCNTPHNRWAQDGSCQNLAKIGSMQRRIVPRMRQIETVRPRALTRRLNPRPPLPEIGREAPNPARRRRWSITDPRIDAAHLSFFIQRRERSFDTLFEPSGAMPFHERLIAEQRLRMQFPHHRRSF